MSAKKPSKTKKVKQVRLIPYWSLLYAWPLIVAGFLFSAISATSEGKADFVLGWAYVALVLLVIQTMGSDLPLRPFIAVLGFLALCGAILYIFNLKGVDIFTPIFELMRKYSPRFSIGLGLWVSTPLTFLYVWMIVWCNLFEKAIVLPGGIVRIKRWMEEDKTFVADNRSFVVKWGDLLERLLFGAGSVTIRDSKNTTMEPVVLRNIPFLSWKIRLIQENKLLEAEEVAAA